MVAIHILYEDNHCLGVVKPAGMLAAGDKTGDSTLLGLMKQYVREKYGKPGNVYLGLVHRLDRPVSGIMLLARTSKAARRLCEQFRTGSVEKVYQALVQGHAARPTGRLVHYLLKDRVRNKTLVVPAGRPGARRAELFYRTLQTSPDRSLLEIRTATGRSHQIRVQLSELGVPIVGDTKYGGSPWRSGTIALHASALIFEHPVKREPIELCSPAPAEWTPWDSGQIKKRDRR